MAYRGHGHRNARFDVHLQQGQSEGATHGWRSSGGLGRPQSRIKAAAKDELAIQTPGFLKKPGVFPRPSPIYIEFAEPFQEIHPLDE
jgi:hypothetical protein